MFQKFHFPYTFTLNSHFLLSAYESNLNRIVCSWRWQTLNLEWHGATFGARTSIESYFQAKFIKYLRINVPYIQSRQHRKFRWKYPNTHTATLHLTNCSKIYFRMRITLVLFLIQYRHWHAFAIIAANFIALIINELTIVRAKWLNTKQLECELRNEENCWNCVNFWNVCVCALVRF